MKNTLCRRAYKYKSQNFKWIALALHLVCACHRFYAKWLQTSPWAICFFLFTMIQGRGRSRSLTVSCGYDRKKYMLLSLIKT